MIRTVQESMAPLFVFVSFFGVTGINRSMSFHVFHFSAGLLALVGLFYYMVFLNDASYLYSPLIRLIPNVLHWSATLYSVFNCFLNRHRFQDCLKRMTIVDETLETFGFAREYEEHRTYTLKLLMIYFLAAVLVMANHFIWSFMFYGPVSGFFMPFVINTHIFINMAINSLLLATARYIAVQFDRVHGCIEKLNDYGNVSWLFFHCGRPNCQRIRVATKLCRRLVIWTVMHLYLELCKTSRELNSVFSLHVVFQMILGFAGITTNIIHMHDMYEVEYRGLDSPTLRFTRSMAMAGLYFGTCFYLNYFYEYLSWKARCTKRTIKTYLITASDPEARDLVTQFMLCTIHRPLRFSALGFFDFGYGLIRKFTASIITVLVIVLQSSESPLY